MPIKHLVLGGGGAGGFAIYGALRHLAKNNFWELNQIESIYSTSIGSLIAALITICDNWTALDDYITKRPWDKVITINPIDILNLWHCKGFLNEKIIKEILEPMLKATDLSNDITLQELYDKTSIDLHIYTTNLNSDFPEKVDISYKSHGDLFLYRAVAMSAAFPIIFAPICDNSFCYIDGGLLNNFPLNDCMLKNPDEKEILGIKISSQPSNLIIDNKSTMVNYIYNLVDGMRRLISTEHQQESIKNVIECTIDINNFSRWGEALTDISVRQDILNIGDKHAEIFLENYSLSMKDS